MSTPSTGSGDVHRSLALMWGQAGTTPATDTERPRLSVTRIVDAAIAIADRDGLDAVTMRRIASELGVGTMSLYRHIPGKEELLDLMLDQVLAGETEPFPDDWRVSLERFARELFALYRRHLWLPFVDQSRPLLGPNAVAGLDALLGGLASIAWTDRQKMAAISTVEMTVASLARVFNGAELAERDSGVSTEEFWQAQEPLLNQAMRSGRFPRLATVDDDTFEDSAAESFEFALSVLLEGIAATLPS